MSPLSDLAQFCKRQNYTSNIIEVSGKPSMISMDKVRCWLGKRMIYQEGLTKEHLSDGYFSVAIDSTTLEYFYISTTAWPARSLAGLPMCM